jgi:hypothetical protein
MEAMNVVHAVANHDPNSVEMMKMRRVGWAPALAAGLAGAAGFGGPALAVAAGVAVGVTAGAVAAGVAAAG